MPADRGVSVFAPVISETEVAVQISARQWSSLEDSGRDGLRGEVASKSSRAPALSYFDDDDAPWENGGNADDTEERQSEDDDPSQDPSPSSAPVAKSQSADAPSQPVQGSKLKGKKKKVQTCSKGDHPERLSGMEAHDGERTLTPFQEELHKFRDELKFDLHRQIGVVLDRLDKLSGVRKLGTQGSYKRSSSDSDAGCVSSNNDFKTGKLMSEIRRVQWKEEGQEAEQAFAVDSLADDVARAGGDSQVRADVARGAEATSEAGTEMSSFFARRGPVKSFAEGELKEEFVVGRRSSKAGNVEGVSSWETLKARFRYMDSRQSSLVSLGGYEYEPTSDEVAKQPAWPWRCRRAVQCLVRSTSFEFAACFTVMLNAGFLGMQVEWQAQHLSDNLPPYYRSLEVLFCVLFSVELFLRLADFVWCDNGIMQQVMHKETHVGDSSPVSPQPAAVRRRTKWDWQWLVFDTVLVVSQIIELTMSEAGDGSNGKSVNLTVVRMLRILRLVRAMRLIRVLKMVQELRVLTTSILSSMKALAWALLLLVMVMYIVGVTLTEIVSDYRISNAEKNFSGTTLDLYWGSLGDSVTTLFQVITSGVDWGDTVELLSKINPGLVLFVALYIAFALLCILNMITGLFLDQALRTAKKERDAYMIHTLQNLFDSADFDHNDRITWEEFERLAATPSMRYVFEQIDLSHEEASTLFRLLDTQHRGRINREEFRSGCNSLRGPAKALDIAFLKKELERLYIRCDLEGKSVDSHMKRLMPVLHSLSSDLTALRREKNEREPCEKQPDKGVTAIA